MIQKILDIIKNDKSFAERYTRAMSELYNIKVLEFLRLKAAPQIISLGADVNVMATQAARSAGYNECLDDLSTFLEFLQPLLSERKLNPDYGGLDIALERGDLNQKEADGLKANNSNST